MTLLRKNSVFLVLSLILWIGLGTILLYLPKADIHLWLNQVHTPFLDAFFRVMTHLGEWVPYVVMAGLLFYRLGDATYLLSSVLVGGGIGQIIKHLVNAPRPLTWFATNYPDIQLPLVDGVVMNTQLSFPSGHTISCFALCMTLSIILTNHKSPITNHPLTSFPLIQAFLFLLALTGSYSRIYLSQHFAMDIWVGMLIGIATPILLYPLFARFVMQKWYKMHFFQKKVH